MSTRYKFWDEYKGYFATFAVVGWIDVFTRNEYREIFVESLSYCIKNKGLVVHAWVLMSNHVHLLISLKENNPYSFSDVMRDLKKYTAMQIIKAIKENPSESRKEWILELLNKAGNENSQNKNFQFWQHGNHPIEITDRQHYFNVLEYIHQNPVRAGCVSLPEHYVWSSACDYAGKKGLVDVGMDF